MIFNVNTILWTIWDRTVCTDWMYQYYVSYLVWWCLNEPKHVAEFLIANIDYQHVVLIDWLNYYIIANHKSIFLRTTQLNGVSSVDLLT